MNISEKIRLQQYRLNRIEELKHIISVMRSFVESEFPNISDYIDELKMLEEEVL